MPTPRPIPSILLDDTASRDELIAKAVARIAWPENLLDCWEWTGTNDQGYAKIAQSVGGRTLGFRVHRLTYAWWFGQDPYPLDIDHMCANTICVNPHHLQAVTPKVNNLRAENVGTINARKTHCKWGHPLYGDNLFMDGNKRRCKACVARRSKAWREKVDYGHGGAGTRKYRLHSSGDKTECVNGHPWIPENIMYRKSGRTECKVCHRLRQRERSRKERERKRRQSD